MKKILFLLAVLLISACNTEHNRPFVIVEKSVYPDTYFLIKTISPIYAEPLYTVINDMNFHYMKHDYWDQMYFSYNVGDTVNFSIDKNKLWKKIK